MIVVVKGPVQYNVQYNVQPPPPSTVTDPLAPAYDWCSMQAVRAAPKPIEKEIIIDVPLAWRLLWEGFGWPLRAVAEYRSGTLLENDANITVSPR